MMTASAGALHQKRHAQVALQWLLFSTGFEDQGPDNVAVRQCVVSVSFLKLIHDFTDRL
jgi:hypothetical protein